MPDIIQDAKRLLKGATPGKWRAADSDIIAKDGNRFIATVSEYSGLDDPSEEYANVQLIAAAPELAQALAEETWEYAAQFKNEDSGKWYTNGFYGTGIHGRKWFASKEEAEQQIERSYPAELVEPREYRIVRRRVSPVEVINE